MTTTERPTGTAQANANGNSADDGDLAELSALTSWLSPGEPREAFEVPRAGLRLSLLEDDDSGPLDGGRHKAPRGTMPLSVSRRLNRKVTTKADIWADNCLLLYEEAVARQWSSATDLPWTEGLTELSDELERAMCQLCTHLVEVEFSAGDAPGAWIREISPEYYEAKMFLSSQVGDEARHLEVFRKRALSNGGGLMRQSSGNGRPGSTRSLLEFEDFTELTVLTHVVGEGQVLSMFRTGELIGQNQVEKNMFRLVAQDEARHVAFGVMHLRYMLETEPERREEIHAQLDVLENIMTDPAATVLAQGAAGERLEPLMVLLGGGLDHVDEGHNKWLTINKRIVREYLSRLEVAGMPERRERMNPVLRLYLQD